MLLRYDPFREFDRLTEEFDRMSPRSTPRPLAMDAVRRGNHVIAQIDVPGVAPEDVEVTVERNVVNVKVSRDLDAAEGDESIVRERRHGAFSRQLMLGDTLDANRLEAEVANGVLTLRIPVAETAKPRKVEVTTGAGDTPSAISA